MTDASARIEELYASHAPMVLAVCRGLLRDRVEADDALQQTFLSAQRALANGSTPRTPESWLAAIARNECLARIRARAVRPLPVGDEVDAVAPDAHAAAVSREQVAGLRNALADLPAQQREAILLREVRGFSYDEVAASLSVTTSAVESLLFRARRRLQLTLREAVTALSPVGWLGPLRELAFRVGGGGGGLGSNEVAKVVAVGVGAAALAGGVVVTPQLVRHGVAAPPPLTTTAPAHSSAAPPSASAQVLPPQPQPPVAGTGIWFTGALGQTTTAALEREPAESGDAGSESVEAGDGSSEPAESAASGGSEREREAPASATAGASETEGETPTTVATAPATGAGDTTTTPETRTTTSEAGVSSESGTGGASSPGGESDGSGDD